MTRLYGIGYMILSLSISLCGLSVIAPGVPLAVHWTADNAEDFMVPSWVLAAIFPVVMLALCLLVGMKGATRLVGHNRSRTLALSSLLLIAAQTYVVLRNITKMPNAIGCAIIVIGVATSVYANYSLKDARSIEEAEGQTKTRRRIATMAFVAGLAATVGGFAIACAG
jgi:Ca2+/Na+ antiporter